MSLSILLELYPQRQRQSAGKRIIRGVEEHIEDWSEILDRVVREAAAKKRRGRR